MKITLYPTASGCYRPPQVLQTVKEYLLADKQAAISSRDAVADLEVDGMRLGAARQIVEWDEMLSNCPQLAVLDNLWFVDPDGAWLFDAKHGAPQELVEPSDEQPKIGVQEFRTFLGALKQAGTEELVLVSETHGVSPAWKAELDAWDVAIVWDAAPALRWRTWQDDVQPPRLLPEHTGGAAIAAQMHSQQSQVLMSLLAEFNDLTYGPPNPQYAGDDKQYEQLLLLLDRLFVGQEPPLQKSICDAVRDHLIFLAWLLDCFASPEHPKSLEAFLAAAGENANAAAE